jgi:hypothetical protein
MIEQEEKLRILLRFDDEDLAEEICLILDYLIKSTFTYQKVILVSKYICNFSNLEFQTYLSKYITSHS